jgi:hypothetical protein
LFASEAFLVAISALALNSANSALAFEAASLAFEASDLAFCIIEVADLLAASALAVFSEAVLDADKALATASDFDLASDLADSNCFDKSSTSFFRLADLEEAELDLLSALAEAIVAASAADLSSLVAFGPPAI